MFQWFLLIHSVLLGDGECVKLFCDCLNVFDVSSFKDTLFYSWHFVGYLGKTSFCTESAISSNSAREVMQRVLSPHGEQQAGGKCGINAVQKHHHMPGHKVDFLWPHGSSGVLRRV